MLSSEKVCHVKREVGDAVLGLEVLGVQDVGRVQIGRELPAELREGGGCV